MLISHSKRFVFIHIPKTGGSSIERALVSHGRWQERFCIEFWPTRKAIGAVNRVMGWTANGYKQWTGIHKHARASVIRAAMPPGLFEEYFSFTVVRNPFDRLVSAFFYGFPASSRIARDSEASEHQAIIDQFRRFVRSPTVAKVLTMQRFVQDADTDELLVNYVARLETIDADFQYLQQRIGLHRASWLPRANVSKTRPLIPLQAWYDSATIDLVLDRYAVDFKQFGYPLAIPEAV